MPRFSLTRLRYQLGYQFRYYQQCRRSRRHLLTLDDRLLEDVGISREQARREGRKPFWKHAPVDRGPYENR